MELRSTAACRAVWTSSPEPWARHWAELPADIHPARKEIIDLLRQRSRPYLFSNSLAPAIVGASLELFDMLDESTELRDHLEEVTAYYRKELEDNGFDIIPGTHPCVPVMLYDEKTGRRICETDDGQGRLRRSILLSGSSEGQGKNPYPGLRKPHERRYRFHREVLQRSKRRDEVNFFIVNPGRSLLQKGYVLD